jgi:hypothetical protein
MELYGHTARRTKPHRRRKPAEQRERIEVDGERPVAERPLQRDADEPVGPGQQVLGRQRRPEYVLEERLTPLLVLGPSARRGVETETTFSNRERRSDNDARAPVEDELHRATAQLGTGRGQAGSSSTATSPSAIRRSRGSRAHDLERIGHVGGRKPWEGPELRAAVSRRDVHAIEEDHVQVRVEFQVRGRALRDHHRPALRTLPRARPEAAPVPAEHGVHENARDGPEELAVEAQTTAQLVRKRQHPLSERHGREHVLDEIRRGLAHAATHAGWTKSAPFAAERHEMLLSTRITFHARKAATEQSAVQISVELAAHERRQRGSLEPRRDGGVERLDVVADDRV